MTSLILENPKPLILSDNQQFDIISSFIVNFPIPNLLGAGFLPPLKDIITAFLKKAIPPSREIPSFVVPWLFISPGNRVSIDFTLNRQLTF
jgi:hypothetical protein